MPKFRTWLKSVGEMVEVLEIDFYNKEVAYIWTEQVSDDELEQTREVDSLNNVKLMQSTGLKDKNGLEVYFNDVVEDEYGHRYEVVFEGDCLRCNGVRKIRDGHKPKNRWFGIDLEIIGNRFENPKLLEEEE